MAAILCMYKVEHRMQICLRNPRIACSTDHVNSIPLRELNLNSKEPTFKNLCTIRDPRSMSSSRPTKPYHFPVDLIWCDGTLMIIC